MSDEMVECVARAIAASKVRRGNPDPYTDLARAAILAMREPMEEMVSQAVTATLLERFSDRYSGDKVMHEPEAALIAGQVIRRVLAALESDETR